MQMNLYVSQIDDKRSILFYPNTLSLFLTSNRLGEVAKMISEGKTYNSVREEFKEVSQQDYNKLQKLYQHIKPDVEVDVNQNKLKRLVLNISNDCNMKCAYCYANGGNYNEKINMMTTRTLIKILDTMYDRFQEIEIIQLFGGEPMLNEEAIVATCDYVKRNKKNTKVGMVSNGTILTDQIKKLTSNHELSITVSLDGEEVHDELRKFKNGKASFDIVKKNILELRKISDQPSCIEVTYTKYHQYKGISIKDICNEIREMFPGVWVHIVEVVTNDENYKNIEIKRDSKSFMEWLQF